MKIKVDPNLLSETLLSVVNYNPIWVRGLTKTYVTGSYSIKIMIKCSSQIRYLTIALNASVLPSV